MTHRLQGQGRNSLSNQEFPIKNESIKDSDPLLVKQTRNVLRPALSIPFEFQMFSPPIHPTLTLLSSSPQFFRFFILSDPEMISRSLNTDAESDSDCSWP